MALKTDYKDFIPPDTGRRWKITQQDDESAIIEDITEYQQEGDTLGAKDVNGIAKQCNAAMYPNLLDNSDFINVVNQRGKTSYNSAYTIDRWKLGVDGPIVEVVSGKGVKLSNGDPTYGAPLVQKVNPVSVSESRGNYTFSVCDDGGSIYSVTGKFTENSESITPWGKLLLTLYSGIPAVQIKLNHGQEKTFVWAKLELGDVVTPWKPKGYGAELAECLRYFRKHDGRIFVPLLSRNTSMYGSYRYSKYIALDPPMRVAPSVTLHSLGNGFTLPEPAVGANGIELGINNAADNLLVATSGFEATADL